MRKFDLHGLALDKQVQKKYAKEWRRYRNTGYLAPVLMDAFWTKFPAPNIASDCQGDGMALRSGSRHGSCSSSFHAHHSAFGWYQAGLLTQAFFV